LTIYFIMHTGKTLDLEKCGIPSTRITITKQVNIYYFKYTVFSLL